MNTVEKHELPDLRDTQSDDLSSYKPELSLEQCYAMARRMSASLLLHKSANPDSANLEQAEDFACGIVLNLASEIRNLSNYEAHQARCPCDDCSAARSDEHHDRKRDGITS